MSNISKNISPFGSYDETDKHIKLITPLFSIHNQKQFIDYIHIITRLLSWNTIVYKTKRKAQNKYESKSYCRVLQYKESIIFIILLLPNGCMWRRLRLPWYSYALTRTRHKDFISLHKWRCCDERGYLIEDNSLCMPNIECTSNVCWCDLYILFHEDEKGQTVENDLFEHYVSEKGLVDNLVLKTGNVELHIKLSTFCFTIFPKEMTQCCFISN